MGPQGRASALWRDPDRLVERSIGAKEIATRVLSRELKALAGAGLVARNDYCLVPPKVEYRLTPAGESLVPIIAAIRKWGERYLGGSNHRGGDEQGPEDAPSI